MKYMDLRGQWILSTEDGGIETTMTLPDDIAHSLIENDHLPHPYWSRNELNVQWINQTDWILEREFELSEEDLQSPLIRFQAGSLDTMARIEINGKIAGESDNMFIPADFPVKDFLLPGTNRIRLYLDSPEKEALKRADKLSYKIPAMAYPVFSPNRNLVRKVQCHAGWDWGPCLMTSGVYHYIRLEMSSFSLTSLHYDLEKTDSDWKVSVHIGTESTEELQLPLSIDLSGAALEELLTIPAGSGRFTKEITVKSPALWWPSGQGEQQLYHLNVSLGIERKTAKVGFRTIEVKVEDDAVGRSMTFRVNGRDIFCKGANWIPSDALPGEQSREKTEWLLRSAKDAHMNMIRVWGGGQYEPDDFYDLCDELGLLVWQDFMFSCSLYPSNAEFLDSVDREARSQILRLKNHPSLALWCGNNEDIGALTWFEESRTNRDMYLIDYDRLNEGVLGKAVKELDPNRQWWPSSPSAGEGDYSDCWHDDSKGDMHYWSVWHEGKPFESYYDVLPRFCSEFGFQSFPSLEQVKTYAPEEEWNVSSPSMMHHQKNDKGNEIIISTLCRYFRFPQEFQDFLYLSQVQQAWAIQTAVDYWRSNRPVCMGAVYWQLNDNWPVASWSSIEYSGNWKLLHYNAARFFRPVQISGWMKDGVLHGAAINDNPETVNAAYQVNFRSFDGSLNRQLTGDLTLPPGSSQKILEETLGEENQRREGFLELILKTEKETIRNFLFLHLPRMCNLQQGEIQKRIEKKEEFYLLTLSCEVPAFFTYLTAPIPGHFSDNGFLMMPGEEKIVTFRPSGTVEEDPLFQVRHLRETY